MRTYDDWRREVLIPISFDTEKFLYREVFIPRSFDPFLTS